MPEVDLETVSTDDLLEEIGNRFESMLFTGIPLAQDVKDGTKAIRFWQGDYYAVVGLAYCILNDMTPGEAAFDDDSEGD